MLRIHPNTAALAKLTSNEPNRYPMGGIHVVANEDGYRLEATNGKFLGIVTGSNVTGGPGEEFPDIPALLTAPNGASQALIPAKEFARACKDAPVKHFKAVLRSVAVVMGDDCSTLATTDLESNLIRQPRNISGRFPDTRDIVPTSPPTVTLRLDPDLLAQLLTVASEFTGEKGGVTLEVRDGNTPVVIRTGNGEQEFTGLLMPLTTKE